ncbi:Arc family DNA-binding protein [Martelella sp. FLE1502]
MINSNLLFRIPNHIASILICQAYHCVNQNSRLSVSSHTGVIELGRVPSRGTDQFMVRFPDGMRERIREEADKNGRSMNSEIIHRLELTFDADVADIDAPKADWPSTDTEKTLVLEIAKRAVAEFVAQNKKSKKND